MPGSDLPDRYAVLLAPSANRVYTAAAPTLLQHELQVMAQHLLGRRLTDFTRVDIGGAEYLQFSAPDLLPDDLDCLANASALYALFRVRGELLQPLAVSRLDCHDTDLLSILKYRGKTNETFTKLLLNLTAAAAVDGPAFRSRPLRVLDPMCGRGTTVNQAVMYGWHAHGIEVDPADVEAYAAFLSRWLKSKRMKHRIADSRLRRNRTTLGRRVTADFAADKDDWKAGRTRTVEMINADTLQVAQIHAAGHFDLIVTDAPYGIAHGAERGTSKTGSSRISRDPTDLLTDALPGWVRVLRAGGAIGIGWNTQQTGRDELTAALQDNGMQVLDDQLLRQFAHRVDQGIDRDLIIASKPR